MSNKPRPPQLAPAPFPPDDPTEPITGSHRIPASLKDVRTARAELDERIDQSRKSTEIRATLLFVLGGLATIGTGFLSVRAIAQDAGAAPVAMLSSELRLTQAELQAHKKEEADRSARYERKLERQDEKQDLILDALRVPLWKRPTDGKDAGQ